MNLLDLWMVYDVGVIVVEKEAMPITQTKKARASMEMCKFVATQFSTKKNVTLNFAQPAQSAQPLSEQSGATVKSHEMKTHSSRMKVNNR